jgi:hypothetical protein
MRGSGSRQISAVDCEIKARTAVVLIWLGEREKWGLSRNRAPAFSPKCERPQYAESRRVFRRSGFSDETA